jgi:sulfonate transport system substrate-binding protein
MLHWLSKPFAGTFLAALCVVPVASHAAGAELSLAYTKDLYSSEVIIAQDQGFFTKNGVTITPRIFTSGRLALDALMAGAVDMSTVAETPITAAVMAKRPIAIVARIARTIPLTLVRKDAGINTVADLRGKRIGVNIGSGSEVYTFNLLASVGLKPSDVSEVNIGPEDMPGALASHSVDAISTWQPFISYAQKLGGNKVELLPTGDVYSETWNLVTMRKNVQPDDAAITAVVKSLIEAEQFMKTNRDQSLDILAKVIGVSRATIEQSLPKSEFHVVLDASLMSALNGNARWRLATGNVPPNVTAVPDFNAALAPHALKSTDAARVTIGTL